MIELNPPMTIAEALDRSTWRPGVPYVTQADARMDVMAATIAILEAERDHALRQAQEYEANWHGATETHIQVRAALEKASVELSSLRATITRLEARAPRGDGWMECAVEAHALLQCDPDVILFDEGSWESGRRAWIQKWTPKLSAMPLPEPPKEDE
jgi:hypothetical protein